jgi:hypothetical protein
VALIDFEIRNWQKFNPRSDRANYSWFRLQNDFFHDQAIFELSDGQKVLYLFVLCEASKKNSGRVSLTSEYLSAVLKRKPSEIIRDSEHLKSVGVLTENPAAFSRLNDGKEPALRPATDERTNETGLTENPAANAAHPIVEIWNRERGTLAGVRGISGSRAKALKLRWEENPSEAFWIEVITRAAASPFLTGKNDRNWRADFDFILKPDSAHRILEGKYDGKGPTNSKPRTFTAEDIRAINEGRDANG